MLTVAPLCYTWNSREDVFQGLCDIETDVCAACRSTVSRLIRNGFSGSVFPVELALEMRLFHISKYTRNFEVKVMRVDEITFCSFQKC